MAQITIDLPSELIESLGSVEEAGTRAKQALVLDLLRRAEISQGRAAELLGLSRWDILDLMAEFEIPSGPQSADELAQDVDVAVRYSTVVESRGSRLQ